MTPESRETRTSAAFVALTDTLVSAGGTVDLARILLSACLDLLDVDAGGLLLADGDGDLRLIAASTDGVEQVEIVQLGVEAGPGWACFSTGEPVSVGDIEAEAGRWPTFRRAALMQGYRSVHVTPLRLDGRPIGTMSLFRSEVGALNVQDVALARSLADVAAITIHQGRGQRNSPDLSAQLQEALDGRIVVEQAKGLLSQSLNVGMDEAFAVLRNQARSSGRPLQSVATAVVDRQIVLAAHDDTAARVDEARRRGRVRTGS